MGEPKFLAVAQCCRRSTNASISQEILGRRSSLRLAERSVQSDFRERFWLQRWGQHHH